MGAWLDDPDVAHIDKSKLDFLKWIRSFKRFKNILPPKKSTK